jgi:hypothetical protein
MARAKSKASDVKSGKFRLPLSLGTITPKEPPQKKARVITYLPPPPSKEAKNGGGTPSRTETLKPGMDGTSFHLRSVSHSCLLSLAFQNPRTRTSGLPSPPPSDETAPRAHPRLPCSSIRMVCSPATNSSAGRSVRYVCLINTSLPRCTI